MKRTLFTFLLAAIGLPMAAGQATQVESSILTGTVTYREKVALPKGSTVQVMLEDLSNSDAGSLVAQTTVTTQGEQVPIHFVLNYDKSRVDLTHQFGLRVIVRSGGKMLFGTTSSFPATLNGHDAPAQIVVERLSETAMGVPNLEGTSWLLTEMNGVKVTGLGAERANLMLDGPNKAFSAYVGVNQIGGGYMLNGTKLKFGPIRSTLMAGAPDAMRREKDFTNALTTTTTAKVFGQTLVLYSGAKIVLKFTPKPAV